MICWLYCAVFSEYIIYRLSKCVSKFEVVIFKLIENIFNVETSIGWQLSDCEFCY